MATTIIAVPGTFETNTAAGTVPQGLLGQIALWLKDFPRFQYRTVAYTAAFGNGASYFSSKADGVAKLEAMIISVLNSDPTGLVALVGYSQGAAIVGDVAYKIGRANGVCSASKVAAVGLIGDPNRRPADYVNSSTPVGGQGIGGPRAGGWGLLEGSVFSYCNPGDIVCSIDPVTQPLMPIIANNVGGTINLTDPNSIANDFATFMRTTNWASIPGVAPGAFSLFGISKAILDALNTITTYRASGAHTTYHVRGGMNGHSATESLSSRILERG